MPDFMKHIETAEASLIVKLNEMKKYNVVVDGHRTSISLEPMVWEILNNVAQQQRSTVHELCEFINEKKQPGANLSSAIRVFLLSYLYIHYEKD